MSIHQFDTIVTKKEADALKEMIFKRVRERAEVLAENTNTKYTTDARFEIMDLAHASLEGSNNPFAKITKNTEKENSTEKVVTEDTQKNSKDSNNGLGFSTVNYSTKERIKEKNKITTSEYVKKAIDLNIEDAHAQLSRRGGFMGALNFLNSQASVSLANRSQNGFDALA